MRASVPRSGSEVELLPDGRWAIPAGRESWEQFTSNVPEELVWLVLAAMLTGQGPLPAPGKKPGVDAGTGQGAQQDLS